MSSRGSVVHHPSSSSYYGPNAIKTPHSPRRGSLARASHQSAGEVAQASGISLETWNRLYVALSQYAHSSPFAVGSSLLHSLARMTDDPRCNWHETGTGGSQKEKGVAGANRLPLAFLAPRPGLEPGTYGLTVRRSTN